MTLSLPDRLPDWVLTAPEPTSARYPDEEGFVEDDGGARAFYEVYGDAPEVLREFLESVRAGGAAAPKEAVA